MSLIVPSGMSRRHFMQHLATSVAMVPGMQFLSHLQTHAADVKKKQKACILLWMGGGPPTIDIWDLKPESKNGGDFKPIKTDAPGVEISEHMPLTAKQFKHLSLVRSMSTREADHGRGRYYMHTTFVPNPTVVHPTFGSVVSEELGGRHRPELEIPSFVSIDGGSESAGFLGMINAPFTVDSNGNIRNADTNALDRSRLENRFAMLDVIESSFIGSKRGDAPQSHKDVYKRALNLMTSKQMQAFKTIAEDAKVLDKVPAGQQRIDYLRKVGKEDPKTIESYGNNAFGRGCLMARRLVEAGVPFIEVNLGGWDLHANVFNTLENQRLPVLDKAIAALTSDLVDRGMIDDVVLVWMGEFARTPRINQDVGRDHWANSWTVMMGGGGLKNGQAVGATDKEGLSVEGQAYLPENIWATVAHALGIPLDREYHSKNGRPIKIANSGTPIKALIG